MISIQDWVTISNLKKHNLKFGTRAIAKLPDISRNTVKKALKEQSYQRKSGVFKEISNFHDFIKDPFQRDHFCGKVSNFKYESPI